MRFYFFIVLFSFFSSLFCESLQYLYIKKIAVHKLKGNGKHWDSFKGNPDLICNLFTLNDGIWTKTFSTSTYSNVLEINEEIATQISISPNTQIKIEIIDVDLGDNDLVGKIDITLSKQDLRGNGQEISFGRVAIFSYFFSPHETVAEKKLAEKVEKMVNEEVDIYRKKIADSILKLQKTIEVQKKILEEKQKRISEYAEIIKHLTDKVDKLQKENEDETWEEFEDDLKEEELKEDNPKKEELKEDK